MLNRIRSGMVSAGAVAALLATTPAVADNLTPIAPGIGQWPASGSITYNVLHGENGMKLGEAQHQWTHDGQRYSMQTRLETTGVAGMLYDFRYTQRSEGRVLPDGLQPEHFEVDQSGKKPQAATFNWQTGKVTLTRKGKQTEADIKPGDQDILSVWHLLGTHGAKTPVSELNLATSRAVATASVEVLKQEKITLPIGEVDCLHAKVTDKNGKLTIDLWLDKKRQLAPVRILIVDDKGKVFDQQATAVILGENKAPVAQQK